MCMYLCMYECMYVCMYIMYCTVLYCTAMQCNAMQCNACFYLCIVWCYCRIISSYYDIYICLTLIYGGFLKWGYPQIIHLSNFINGYATRNHLFLGIHILGHPHMYSSLIFGMRKGVSRRVLRWRRPCPCFAVASCDWAKATGCEVVYKSYPLVN